MVLGLIGGAGSGKSAAAEILQNKYGYRVLQTDLIAKQLMNGDGALKDRLKEAFGNGIYAPDGQLDRKAFAELIYQDPEKRRESDRIVHPAVWEEVRRQLSEQPERNTVVETALPGQKLRSVCDRILYVQADPEVRIHRMIESRNYSREYAESILKNQKDEAWFLDLSDAVVRNDRGLDELEEELGKVLEKCL